MPLAACSSKSHRAHTDWQCKSRHGRESLLLQIPTVKGRPPTTLSLTMCSVVMHLMATSASPIGSAAPRCDCVTKRTACKGAPDAGQCATAEESSGKKCCTEKQVFACEAHVDMLLCCHLPTGSLALHVLPPAPTQGAAAAGMRLSGCHASL